MAQVSTEVALETPQERRAGEGGLVAIADWLKADEEAEAKAGVARLPDDEPSRKKSKTGPSRVEATTIVNGRPTTNQFFGANDLLSYAEPLAPKKVDLGGKNWVGQLFEYRQAHPSRPGPDYQESSPSLNLFTCLVSIGEHGERFGDTGAIFTRKKDAKQYAAKLAVEWLIANHHMPSDGSVSFPKVRVQPAPNDSAASASVSASGKAASPGGHAGHESGGSISGPSYGQRVAEMCAKLAMSPPMYVITPHPGFQAMYSGHAVFENTPVVQGKVGEFANVYGKKRARETCAEKVLAFLEGIAADRSARSEVGVEERGPRVPDVETETSLLGL